MKINCLELIEKGVCKSDCCGVVPFKKGWVEKHKADIQKQFITKHEIGRNLFVYETANLKCIFLTSKNRCAVYDDRPEICRLFGTGTGTIHGQIRNIDDPLLKCPHEYKEFKL